jgi:predicted hydrocarbon binding protein
MPDRSFSDPSRRPATDEFIRARPAEGMLLTSDDRRVTALPETLIQTLHRGFTQAGGDNRQVLYHAGYEWGLQDMLDLNSRMRQETGTENQPDLWRRDAPFVLERWAAPFAAAGWGACIFDLSFHHKGITFVELRQSAAAAAVGRAAAPVCHLYAGLFAGALSFYDRVETHAVEIECAALGHGCCRFIVGPGAVIDEAESARQSGLAHEAIRRLVLEARAPGASRAAGQPPTPAAAAAPAKAARIPWKK